MDAIELCIKTVIPSLFPFMTFSILLNGYWNNVPLKILQPITRMCKIQPGNESIFILGILGGYPVGAQSIYHAWKQNQINTNQAHRMLGFCNNAGPAYIFGIASVLFKNNFLIWATWLIHVISAFLVGCLLPTVNEHMSEVKLTMTTTFPLALEKAIKTIAMVCGWIILFRVLIVFINRWFGLFLSQTTLTLVSGILELTNGCVGLLAIYDYEQRFILLSAFLALGGCCVTAQTISATKELGTGMYLPGKIMQCCISIGLACIIKRLYFGSQKLIISFVIILSCSMICLLIKILLSKKTVAFISAIVYNKRKLFRRGHAHVVSEKAPTHL